VDPALRERSCAELGGGTAGSFEALDLPAGRDTGNGLAPGERSDAPVGLPRVVPFKTATETYNRRYQWVARGGLVWFRSNAERTGIRQAWRELPVPPCFYRGVREIAADDDELVAIGPDRRIYTMDHALRGPEEFNWTSRWGPIFWMGSGHLLPRGVRSWAWSVISQREDGTWRDAAGNAHPVGDYKVSHIWTLGRDGRRLGFNDPWLARDRSYEMCGPHRGRFRVAGMSASGSTVFVIGRHGDMFTRLFDFDISGSDPAFFHYSYANQRGRPDPVIQLPPPAWREQPKVPGRITRRISIEKRGRGAVHRTLRVEGRDARGRLGYWQKDLPARRSRAWRFHRSGRRPPAASLPNPRRDTSALGLTRSRDLRYVRPRADGWSGELANYNVACSPARLRVRLASRARFELVLHTADGLRLEPRPPGLSAEPRGQFGELEVPLRVLRSRDPAVRRWLTSELGGRRFTTVPVNATTGAVEVAEVGWRFVRRRR
jgi:hypothetical protein